MFFLLMVSRRPPSFWANTTAVNSLIQKQKIGFLLSYQVILWSMFFHFNLQIHFESSVSFSYMPHLKDVLWLAYLEVSWAQTDVKPCFNRSPL